MKKELNPAVFIAIIAVLVVGLVAGYFMTTRESSAKVDLGKIDPKDLKDEDPIRRGQPGYRERITDAPN